MIISTHWTGGTVMDSPSIQKWQKISYTKPGKVWLQTAWKRTEKREVLSRNRCFWDQRFKKFWKIEKVKVNMYIKVPPRCTYQYKNFT